jgi:hypothetical protein
MLIVRYVGMYELEICLDRAFQLRFVCLVCTTEQQLIRKLLQYYEPSVRPVLNAQGIVTISFRMEITQLFELVSYERLRFNERKHRTLVDCI